MFEDEVLEIRVTALQFAIDCHTCCHISGNDSNDVLQTARSFADFISATPAGKPAAEETS